MASYSRALASARRHDHTLFLCQAVDFCEQVASLGQGGLNLYKQMLAVPNVAHTGRLPGMVLLHIGMRVRLTTQVLPPWAVQDAAGTIMEIEASLQDRDRVLSSENSGDTAPAAEMVLTELPSAVYIKLDKCNREFLPPTVCQHHQHSGFDKDCARCRAFEGWVLIEPLLRTWSFVDPTTRMLLHVSRSGLALMPAEASPLYSLQGATCDPGLIAHFQMPRRADDDINWLIVYALLSRVRSLANLRSIGITSQIRKIIEAGPPSMLAENFERLFRTKITNTKAAVAAKCALGWQ